jgi:uncharacterized protein
MQINVDKLKREEAVLELVSVEALSQRVVDGRFVTAAKPLQVRLTVANVGKAFVVGGELETELMAVCDRCLEPFAYAVTVTAEDEWLTPEQAMLVDPEEQENAYVLVGDEVEVTDRLEELLLMQLPMRYICAPECRGLCPHCGSDLNQGDCGCARKSLDPRMAIFANWRKEV